MDNKFGDLLQTLRKERGWTQQQLADLLHVTNKTVSKWERNEAYPETATLIELSKLFQISLDDLLNGKMPEKRVEVQDIPAQNILNNWQLIKAELFSKVMILLGLMGFYALYFLTKLFVPSFFVLTFFLVISFCFILFRNAKASVFTGKKAQISDWAEWIALALASLILVIPCINFPIKLDTLEKQWEYALESGGQPNIQGYFSPSGILYGYSHLTFSNYLTWFPFLLVVAQFVYLAVQALLNRKLTRSVKLSFLSLVAVFGLLAGMNGIKNAFRPYQTMSENGYQNYKERYVIIADAFEVLPDNLSDIDSLVLNEKIIGKKRYESYMNVAGFNDRKCRVYYDLSTKQKEIFKMTTCILTFILSIGSVIYIKKKENMPE